MFKGEIDFQNENNTIVWHARVTKTGELIP